MRLAEAQNIYIYTQIDNTQQKRQEIRTYQLIQSDARLDEQTQKLEHSAMMK